MKYVKTLRYFQVLPNERRRTVNYGLETICYRAPFLWANLPPEYKLANSLNIFKRKIKNWKGENCPCRLCKTYVRELGYISSPRSLSISTTFFFLIQLKIKSLNAQPVTAKKIKNKNKKQITAIYLYYHLSILISFNSESF